MLLWCAERAVRAGFEPDGFVRSRVFYLPETVLESGCVDLAVLDPFFFSYLLSFLKV